MVPDDTVLASPDEAQVGPGAACSVAAPDHRTAPVVFASPHSGDRYPPSFLAATRLDLVNLRRSEDAFVDRIYAAAPKLGAPLLKAHFPRSYVDPNREAFELDPAMFDGPLPDYANVTSPRVAAGLGTVARVVTSGEAIYQDRLDFAEVKRRIDQNYVPYHAALKDLIGATVSAFGACLLVDCHSMPSIGGPMDSDSGHKRVDFVLGDRFGMSCARSVTDRAERVLRRLGYSVRRNVPYAGGFTTRHYGRPRERVHALQIEINRALYMDEMRVAPIDNLQVVRRHMTELMEALVAIDPAELGAP